MKIKVKTVALKEAIHIVQKAVSPRSTLPILKGILLIAKENELILVGNDLQIGIETSCTAHVFQTGSVVIDSKVLGNLVHNITDEHVNISVDSTFNVAITCQYLDVKIIGYSSSDYPQLEFIMGNETISIPEHQLSQMIQQTLFAVAETDYIQMINGLLLQLSQNELIMAASDRFRFAMTKQTISNPTSINRRCVIPGCSVKEIKKLLNNHIGTAKIAFGQQQIQFILGRTKVLSRLLQGEYIHYESILPEHYSSTVVIKTKDLVEALEISSVFADKTNSAVLLNIISDHLEVKSISEMGNISKVIPAKISGNLFETAFNIKYLLEGIKVITEDELIISFVNGARLPAVINTNCDEHYNYLLSPVLVAGIN